MAPVESFLMPPPSAKYRDVISNATGVIETGYTHDSTIELHISRGDDTSD